jgi:hypothetical protein
MKLDDVKPVRSQQPVQSNAKDISNTRITSEVPHAKLKRSLSPHNYVPNKIQKTHATSRPVKVPKPEKFISPSNYASISSPPASMSNMFSPSSYYGMNSAQVYYEQLTSRLLNNTNDYTKALIAAYAANIAASEMSPISPSSSISSNNSLTSTNMPPSTQPSICSNPYCAQCLNMQPVPINTSHQISPTLDTICQIPNCTKCKTNYEPMLQCCWLIEGIKCGRVFTTIEDLQHHVNTHTLVNESQRSLTNNKISKKNKLNPDTYAVPILKTNKRKADMHSFQPVSKVPKTSILTKPDDCHYKLGPNKNTVQIQSTYFNKTQQASSYANKIATPIAHYPPNLYNS